MYVHHGCKFPSPKGDFFAYNIVLVYTIQQATVYMRRNCCSIHVHLYIKSCYMY